MNAVQHTPGPWHLIASDDPTVGLLIKSIPGEIIAECEQTGIMIANARLIAAAPDLLAAARSLEIFVSGFEGDELQEGVDRMLANARAAIAKATAAAA